MTNGHDDPFDRALGVNVAEEHPAQAEQFDSLSRLAGGIAHDFNNLLTAILGHTELLLDRRAADDPDRPGLEQIRQAGQLAATLTQQLLAYSRKQVLAPVEVDLNQTVASLHARLRRLVRDDITVSFQPSSRPAVIRIDPVQVDQIIVNLVLNARDAIATTGRILIDITCLAASSVTVPLDVHVPADEYVRLRVMDDGVGIPSESRAHLFEPFFAVKDGGRGAGLGLASVYGIVRQSGGFIDVESELGRGTTFEIHFPVTESSLESLASRSREGEQGAGRATILLVEDEDAVRSIAGTMLRRQGYVVLDAPTPARACEIFSEQDGSVDLLLTDVVMPEMNGPALAQRLAALDPELRVLFMSGYVDVASPFDVGNPNITFLNKPFQSSVLLSKVHEVLTRPRG